MVQTETSQEIETQLIREGVTEAMVLFAKGAFDGAFVRLVWAFEAGAKTPEVCFAIARCAVALDHQEALLYYLHRGFQLADENRDQDLLEETFAAFGPLLQKMKMNASPLPVM